MSRKSKILIWSAAASAALVGVVAWVGLHLYAQTPEAILAKLAAGRGDPQDLIMRLNVSRGDVVGALIRAAGDGEARPEFRGTVVELLFRHNRRAREERIEAAIGQALTDPEPVVRRAAAAGLATYADDDLQVALVDCVADPDPQVRRQAYLVLGARAGYTPADLREGLWKHLSETRRKELVALCRKQMQAEQDAEMRLLASAIVGREVELRAAEAAEALQKADADGAERILREALEMNPGYPQAQVRLFRFLLKHRGKEAAVAFGRQCGALIEVPRLSEAPVIDGDPEDPVWRAEAYKAGRFFRSSSRWIPQPTEGKSEAYIGHRDGKIYIAILGYEDDLTRLIQAHTARDSDVWQDDCVEICFDPDNTATDYYKFTINPVNCMYDKFNQDRERNFTSEHQAKVFRDRGYWACEFAIDGREMDNHPIGPGTIWSLNLFRARIGAGSEHGAMWPPFGHATRIELYPIAIFQ